MKLGALTEKGESINKGRDLHNEMVEFDKTYSDEIKTHINSNAYTDRRVAGSIVGTAVLGSLGFISFSGALSFGLGGCNQYIMLTFL
jgi:hypothetical protein